MWRARVSALLNIQRKRHSLNILRLPNGFSPRRSTLQQTPLSCNLKEELPQTNQGCPSGGRTRRDTMMELRIQLIPTGEIIMAPGKNGENYCHSCSKVIHSNR
ncbi:hypothetical protein DPEC_G00298580 [Dallia pectoralis]|uniref:Uncharacterized protein n=1 Tax=Dallia pectoralis TaxID=75939 RepID=A0ACC2FG72_DALPE|nr:hypothetical protein DPEC_G00298580 [Dallia pectoralis]